MSTSLLIVFIGMSVPILAAAPFYIADRRRTAPEAVGGAELRPGVAAPQIWPAAEPEVEIPQARTAEEANALADTVRIERSRVAQP
ncbi:hypothetical protein [Saccharopolyspora dendranthemae]|uniref:Uncharacterized protein n=1 Tax=Saccharopolyspora dendranthemae TaxID=1181886 RepID=A0A561U2F5_9PSEU|nr:hypothetical protein [Saccharopolyspora dendranthemae]TWF93555.1 hypothetical protein FHU35_15408 [Saccharopolyspora dendranthemae]